MKKNDRLDYWKQAINDKYDKAYARFNSIQRAIELTFMDCIRFEKQYKTSDDDTSAIKKVFEELLHEHRKEVQNG